MLPPAEPPAPRAFCYRCHKAARTCVCQLVPRIDNRTPVLVLQHPRERTHALGTLRLVALGLARARIEVAWDAGRVEDQRPAWVPDGAALLYPGPGSRDVRSLAPGERPAALVVIDGTWHTARTLHRDKRWLRELPTVHLSPDAPSRYRIRREPSERHLSTVEAIVQALGALEPETAGLDSLLAAFDAMIDTQLACVEQGRGAARLRERRPVSFRGLPTALVEEFADLVVCHTESSRRAPTDPRELLGLAALHPSSGREFAALVRPDSGLPGPAHLAHLDLDEGAFAEALAPEEARARFRAYLAALPGMPRLAAWNLGTLDLVTAATGAPPSTVALKDAYRTTRGRGTGSLEHVARALALAPEP
ncbi:MAG: DTW domain-containing protein, partial [Deltaproteobacteria bacterium]|nr:DTW domain-containing protein [Deltaproteobacteria bacterium]